MQLLIKEYIFLIRNLLKIEESFVCPEPKM